MRDWKPLFILMCWIWLIFGVFTFSLVGHEYVGLSYFESENFRYELDEFTENLGPLIMNMPTETELKKGLTVSQREIEEHRNYYGSLGVQIDNIKAQYEGQIREATDNNATELKNKLEAERDAKIKDITANFEDDEHVRAKIMKEKEAAVKRYIQEAQQEAQRFKNNFRYYAYNLVDMETGKQFVSGNIEDDIVYKKVYTGKQRMATWSISNKLDSILSNVNIDVQYVSYGTSKDDIINEFTNENAATHVTSEDSAVAMIAAQEHLYTGTIAISSTALQQLGLADDYKRFTNGQIAFYIVWVTSIIAAFFAWRDRKAVLHVGEGFIKKETRLSVDMQLVLLLITGWLYVLFLYLTFEEIAYFYGGNYIGWLISFVIQAGIMFSTAIFLFIQLLWLYHRIKTVEQFKNTVQQSYLWKLGETATDFFLNRSIALHAMLMLATVFFGGGSLVATVLHGNGFTAFVMMLCLFLGVPSIIIFLANMGYLNRIMKDTADMAAGRLNRDVKVKGKSPLARHAENLNHLREGVRTSMHEQAKSERLKTELITNVSHDLRTPLTSIITYTDLLKNPDITEEERQQYIHILDKKSDRLKVLIEDLFEVSKMASGNIELHRSRVDLTQLVQQAVGEHEEDLAKSRLDLRMTMPHEPIYAYVDGQKWWRLIDNLIVNVLKYALEGTRVYVTLKRTASGDAEFTVKNVAKYEISENADELFERFKRADASRHTDGSGLGLAIAQSIVDLHGARMSIEVDGDLFKVIVNIPAI